MNERIRKGCKSIDELRALLTSTEGIITVNESAPSRKLQHWPHPRWVRINTLKSTLSQQLQTTFADYKKVSSLREILLASSNAKDLYVDKHIPDLVALAPGTNLSTTAAYHNGLIILQDKASCFPAYLLDPKPEDGTCLDACAAPGNKTTHLAAILQSRCQELHRSRLWACERDKARGVVLDRMVSLAGCHDIVTVKAGEDFLLLDPEKLPWKDVGSLLLDPSCSGSGIVGRDEALPISLPASRADIENSGHPRKRKRKRSSKTTANPRTTGASEEQQEGLEEKPSSRNIDNDQLAGRLKTLSAFQLRLLLHAFRFPHARKISYSTCSVHAEENEHVVIAALQSYEATQHGWRLLQRHDQVEGLKSWHVRGDVHNCNRVLLNDSTTADEIAEASIRCEASTEEGTQGFFVAAFVRGPEDGTIEVVSKDGRVSSSNGFDSGGSEASEEWDGLSNTD
ncbi:MAG: hypothetical protein Q9201_005407 [Fulgogasparrea decipioides]